jgi:hypothetical protein
MTTQPRGTGRLGRLFEAADRRRVPLRTILVTVGVVGGRTDPPDPGLSLAWP